MPSLVADLKKIRRDHNLSVQDIYELTRIPLSTIERIEDGTLLEEEERNATYIRSFIRTYAKALGISDEDIIQALDDQIIGIYDGFLIEKYGSGSPGNEKEAGKPEDSNDRYGSRFQLDVSEDEGETPAPEKAEEAEHEKETTDGESGEPAGEPEVKNSDTTGTAEDTPPSDVFRGGKKNPPARPADGDQEEPPGPDPGKHYNRKIPEPPTVSSVDWASIGKRTYSLSRRPGFFLLIILIVIILAAAAFIIVRSVGSHPAASQKAGIEPVDSLAVPALVAAADSAQTAAEKEESGSALPDTIHLTIYAAYGPLGPVRVQTDIANKLNPYWIDEGEGMRFDFRDSINIRGVFHNMILLYNGHPLTDFRKYEGKDEMVHLKRSYFGKHPGWQVVTNDTLPNGVPQPRVVRDRPRF